jgi:hypothetical protein
LTRFLVVWLALLLRLGCLLLFPALAVWAWRAGGGRRLWAVTAAALGVVLLFAAFAASAAGGNALVETHGYSYTLPGSLLLHGLTLGLPMVAASLAVRGAGGRVTSRVALYALGLLVALLGWVAGIVAAVGVVYGLMR